MLPVLLTTPPAKRGAGFLRVMGAPGIKPAEQDVLMFDVLMKHFHYEQSPFALTDDGLRCLNAPTYLLMGEHEAAFTPNVVIRRAQALLPHLAKAEILSGVGHGMITENPDAVNSRMREFFRQSLL
jgi:pimeloyl-ACP methyl ester carboxylesterase